MRLRLPQTGHDFKYRCPRPGIAAAAGCWLAILGCAAVGAEPFIEQVVPPIVARGQTARIRLRGTGLERPEALWSSLPADAMQATPVAGSADGAEFDVTLAPQAPLGLYGLRAATANGLSSIHLFVVDDLPIVEAENVPAGQVLSLPVAVWGTCRPVQIERFTIEVAAGERLTIEAIGSRLGKDFDPLVVVRDAGGRRIAGHDNDGGLCFDCRFECAFEQAGRYTVELSDARYRGADNWSYILKIGHFPVARVALPSTLLRDGPTALSFPQMPGQVLVANPFGNTGLSLQEIRLPGDDAATWLPLSSADALNYLENEPNDAPEQASMSAAPGLLHGCLQAPGDVDWFAFQLAQGQVIDVRGVTWPLGSPVDLELVLTNATGQEHARIDDVQQTQDEARFRFGAPQAGTYRLQVRDMARDGGQAFVYRVEVGAAGPRLEIAAEAPGLCVPQGNWQPIPLKLTRTDFNGPIELELLGAPVGLSLEPARVPADTNEFVVHLRADSAAPVGVHTVQIAARGVPPEVPSNADPAAAAMPPAVLPTCIVRTQPLVDRQLMNVDRIIYALREDQRRLPPSLTDRFAVQVAPPAPFDLALAESAVTLARFQTADLLLRTTRTDGFAGSIGFAARGGPLGDEAELRVQVYARVLPATPEAADVTAVFHSRNLVQNKKDLVYVDAIAERDGRSWTLTRTFDLDVRAAFDIAADQPKLTIAPGGSSKLRLSVQRVKTFAGLVEIVPQPLLHVRLPEKFAVAEGQTDVEIEVQIAAECPPQTLNLRLPAEAQVGEYREDIPGPTVQIEIKKPEPAM